MKNPDRSAVREFLVHELKMDMIGPSSLNEELSESPISHYLGGILYPSDTRMDSEEDDNFGEAAQADDDVDTGTLLASTTNQSSIGMTFRITPGTKTTVTVRAGRYQKLPKPDAEGRTIWQREPVEKTIHYVCKAEDPRRNTIVDGLQLLILARQHSDGNIIVTISLSNVNDNLLASKHRDDTRCFFQPEIVVELDGAGSGGFISRPGISLTTSDADRRNNELLYRHAAEYASGHGCAVSWEHDEGRDIARLQTDLLPVSLVQKVIPDWKNPVQAQQMSFLSFHDAPKVCDALGEIVRLYRGWIDLRDEEKEQLPERYQEAATENMSACRSVADAIQEGVDLLRSDETVYEAFQLANRAMLAVRSRVEWERLQGNGKQEAVAVEQRAKWHPFQLAFILHNLSAVARPEHPARNEVDLLWFPTGGGKTEAYLGLTAFTIFLRRLRGQDKTFAAGTTVLMRYTLRLLTIQQFQRASTLILACERIRRDDPGRLGSVPVSIGLWVGGAATPNRLKEARQNLGELLQGNEVRTGNPCQLLKCPWCDRELSPRNYDRQSLEITCPNPECDFHGGNGMPLYLVDETIYAKRPTLIIGTVDKFARLPWLEDTGAIFGRGSSRRLPPELIIQDELHLISGPLGTVVGLYETAIDYLCTHGGAKPKIIASTATIRKSAEQCRQLFDRGLRQFPPPGLDARDSFFAREAGEDETAGRLYVGVHVPGRSMKTILLRAYAVLLQKLSEHSSEPVLKDPYHTLIGYFNSLRELGGAVRLVQDDIPKRIQLLAGREGVAVRGDLSHEELNSRVSSDDIPRILERMESSLPDGSPIDVVVATNMISVGMDVDRLGLMVVNGQPKMTSEYIQATSRVGRKYPGLIVTVYNWTRPRDRSHFERFGSYHASLYSQVEPVSVTPYSSRARDRALHGVLITMARHSIEGLLPDDGAADFRNNMAGMEALLAAIVERVGSVDPEERQATERDLKRICQVWQELAQSGNLRYSRRGKKKGAILMRYAESARDSETEMGFPTLNSMRGVEPQSPVALLRGRRKP